MTTIVIVEKGGSLKEVRVRNFNINELYKKCGFRINNDFKKYTKWNINIDGKNIIVELWGKEVGKANTENKYDFPPPVDNTLFFGNCALIRYDDDVVDLTKEVWLKVYEKLFGGFEDLGNDDDDDETDELDDIPNSMKTKAGYLKDGFVVDTNSDDEGSPEGDVMEEPCISNSSSDDEEYDEEEDDEHGSELSEEEYCYSDED